MDTCIPTTAVNESDFGGYRSLFENAVEGIYRTTPDGRYLDANPALARIYGYDSPEELIAGLTDIARDLYVNSVDRALFKEVLERDSVVRNFEARVYNKDRRIIWISENARAVRNSAGQVVCYEGTVQDISERKRSEESLRLAAAVFETVGEAIVVTDSNQNILAVNAAFERMTDWTAAEVVAKPCDIFATEMIGFAEIAEIWRLAASGGLWSGETWISRKDSDPFPAALAMSAIPGEDSKADRFVLLLRDITSRRRDEQRIKFHACHDSLTKLVNRRTVMESLAESMIRAERNGQRLAVLYLDVNRFKDINDSFGHGVGDDLLRQVARRLKACVRASDIIGRLGGDEFVIVLPSVADRGTAEVCVNKVTYAFTEPFTINELELYSSSSIGVALYPDDADTAETLLSRADAAMYHAKRNGLHFSFFDIDMDRQAADRVNLENDLRHALATKQFQLAYQPKVDVGQRRIIGAEALIRWRHPERGAVSPAVFIPVAERAGLIGAIDDWVLSEACSQIGRWRERGLDLPAISVNISPAQFHDGRLTDKVRAGLDTSGLDPTMLELEITETMMASDVDRAIEILGQLTAMGVKVSLDDFGTGYSSLAYLKLFPVSTLKIDRTFVDDLPDDVKDGAIISSIIALAENLGFAVIAEGVETPAQARFLRERGCTAMQGFLFSRPLDGEQFARLLETGIDVLESFGP
ncbi:bifunctional diguanylate cyclase/phosphodiesterase [Paramagnetospirillum kuznetsovii]|uniref:Bifunctional diguanylate cyclase/phosphodiesterase n=1 Tax=Paramagnetospirillum kuznetsovii TaxID=2053833 RepID=A0A364P050_9PROT|nr:EAL domain-containing protein [Paramagnetospirillum kuznetsovii]RAU22620.1 bifunctional diguanylate cyclase/phosphodiesterase [Paramagnetospirillum kuznetsovii]